MQRAFLVLGIILIAAAIVWQFAIKDRFNQRFPDGWVWEVNSIGYTSYADAETGEFPPDTTLIDDPINLTVRTVTASAEGQPTGQVLINDHYITRNPLTNVVDWEYTTTAVVDAKTGQYVEGEFAGDYYFIPRNAEQTTYYITNGSYSHLPMTFQQQEAVAGINTYLFSYYGDMPNEGAYSSYQEFADEEDVYCFGFELQYWVEPNTGELVKFREWCEGDWVVNNQTDERLYAISRWGAETSGDDLLRQAENVSNKLNQYQWMNVYVPLLLVLLGVVMVAAAFVPTFLQSNRNKK